VWRTNRTSNERRDRCSTSSHRTPLTDRQSVNEIREPIAEIGSNEDATPGRSFFSECGRKFHDVWLPRLESAHTGGQIPALFCLKSFILKGLFEAERTGSIRRHNRT